MSGLPSQAIVSFLLMSLVHHLKPLYPFYWCLWFTILSHCILSTDVFGSPSQAIVSFLLMSGSPRQAIVSFLLMSLVHDLKPLYPFYWCLWFTISSHCILSTDVFGWPYHAIVSFLLLSGSPSQAIVSFLLMSLVHHLKPLYPFYWCLWFTISSHCILSTAVWFTISSYLYPFYWCLWFTISSHCILSTDVFGSQSQAIVSFLLMSGSLSQAICILSTDVFGSPSQAIVSFLLITLVHHLKPLYPFYWCLVHNLKLFVSFLLMSLVHHLKPLYPFYWWLKFTISSHCILSTYVWFTISSHCILSTDVWFTISSYLYPFYWCLWFTISSHCILSTDVWFTISSYLYPFYWCLWLSISSHCILSTDGFSSPSQAIVSFLLMSGSQSQAIVSFLLMSLVHHLKPLYPFYWCLWFTISSHSILSTDVFGWPSQAIVFFLLMSGSPSQAIVSFLLMSLVHHLKPLYPFYWCLWFTISSHCILSTDVFGSQS